MEVVSQCGDVTEGGASKEHSQSGCVVSQPTANGSPPQPSSGEAPPPPSERPEDGSEDSLATNDVSRLLPAQPASGLCTQRGAASLSTAPPPVCAPPPPSVTSPPPRLPPPPPPPHSSTCSRQHHHPHPRQTTNQKRLSSTKSHASFKSDGAHIKEAAGDDCCAHCLLACLYCQLLSMCSALGECVACGVGGAGCCEAAGGCCCCCVEAAGEAACTEEACQAVLDCGLLEDCCSSADCLEVCLECCSICFPS